ncbi:hypothetical protein P9209_19475 [Prescottella defluvii]|nr:hypothetical protein P9209_19475 [Prescottella defluvii]
MNDSRKSKFDQTSTTTRCGFISRTRIAGVATLAAAGLIGNAVFGPLASGNAEPLPAAPAALTAPAPAAPAQFLASAGLQKALNLPASTPVPAAAPNPQASVIPAIAPRRRPRRRHPHRGPSRSTSWSASCRRCRPRSSPGTSHR